MMNKNNGAISAPLQRLVRRFFYHFGFVPKERLWQASGALSDIQCIVTDCVRRDAEPKLQEIASAVLSRILSSADTIRKPPSWYVHEWEKELWQRYMDGEIKACAYEEPCIKVAHDLSV
jgi:hypothetical protein